MSTKSKAIPTNAANLVWPTDTYRFTTSLKKELIKTASAVNGQRDKLEVLLGTLALATKFVKTKCESDINARTVYLASMQPVTTEEADNK